MWLLLAPGPLLKCYISMPLNTTWMSKRVRTPWKRGSSLVFYCVKSQVCYQHAISQIKAGRLRWHKWGRHIYKFMSEWDRLGTQAKDSIKTDLRARHTVCGDVKWIKLAQHRNQQQIFQFHKCIYLMQTNVHSFMLCNTIFIKCCPTCF